MKVLVSWLKEYVDFDDSIRGLCDRLTFSGIEVEGIDTFGGDYIGMVVGRVRAVDPHPNADRLRLCTVQTGGKDARVVCGAPNVEMGCNYAFAPVGVTLPNGIKLKKAKIRGEVSEGMLCAEDELNLSDNHDGLLVLDTSLEVGTPLADVLGPPETVLHLEVTPNRPDLLSLIGVAREVAALYNTELRQPEASFREEGERVEDLTRVELNDPVGCPRYSARVLHNVQVRPAPEWMRKRLQLAGVRPINNIVDITNYVMLETGQPLHAFDKALLDEGRIIVRKAQPGETVTTLDDEERKLDEDMVVISDAGQAVALAGILGGGGSEINDGTSCVLLECAHFQPSLIRSTSRRLALSTESSYRFERGVDVDGVEQASRRAAAFMVTYAEAQVAPGVIDIYPAPLTPRTVRCRYDRVRSLIGIEMNVESILRIFESLELRVTKKDPMGCTVSIPTFRGDLEREVDLIEEVARIHGLDNIPAPAPCTRLVKGADDHEMRRTIELRGRLVGLGLREILNYSYLSPQLLDFFGLEATNTRVALLNPLSQDQSVLRPSLIPQVVESLGRNANRQISEAAFFELGRTYHRGGNGDYQEVHRLAIGLLGPVGRAGIDKRRPIDADEMFLTLKGVWKCLAAAQRIGAWSVRLDSIPSLRIGYSVRILIEDTPVGFMGLLEPKLASKWRIFQPVGVLEVEVHPLLRINSSTEYVQPVPVYPSISRDVALLVDTRVTNQRILNIVNKVAPKELVKVELFDIFCGEGIGEGKKSLAYSFKYRSAERTLTDEEANRHHDVVKQALQHELHAEIRDH